LTLPRYRQQVEPGLTPVTQAQPAADAGVGLATVGRALVQAGQLTGSIGLQEYERGINSDNARAMAGFGQEAGDTYARFKALRGEQAVQGAELARLALENARKRWGESLSTDAAKGLFERQSTELAGHYGFGVTSHSLDQLREAEEASAGAAHVSAVNQAALHYNDPAMLDTLATQAGAQAYQLRASDEDGRAKVYAIRQDVLASAITGALQDEDVGAARALFEAPGSREALGAKGPELAGKIESAGNARAALSAADEITAAAQKGRKDGSLNGEVVAASLRAIADPKQRELTRTFLTQNATDSKNAWNGTNEDLSNAIWQKWHSSKSIATVMASPEWHSLEGRAAALTETIHDKMLSDVNAAEERAKKIPPSDAQVANFVEFWKKADAGDPSVTKLTSWQMQAWAKNNLAPADRERAIAHYEEALGKTAKTDESDRQYLKDTATASLGKEADRTPAQNAAFYQAQKNVDAYVKANPAATPQDKQKYVNQQFLSYEVPTGKGIFGGTKTTTMTRAQAEAIGYVVGDVPAWTDEQIAQAKAWLYQAGEDVTDENVQNALRFAYGLKPVRVQPTPPPDTAGLPPPGGRSPL
jgi:hypothetical protein